VPPYTSHIGSPKPTGGLTPETTANAEPDHKTIKEGNKGPKSKRTKLPLDTGESDIGRKRAQKNLNEVYSLVKKWKNLPNFTPKNVALAVTLEYVRSIREPVYQDPRLLRNDFTPCQNKSGRAGMAREKRNAERGIFEEMSRYYRLVGESEEGDGVRDGGDDGCIWVWDRPAPYPSQY